MYIITQEQIIKSYFHHLVLVLTNQERVLEANNMELQKSTPAVEEEHNISLKDSSKKLIRNPFTPLLLQKNTQLILHKQYRRENFF